MKTITKTQLLEDAKNFYGIEHNTNITLQNYIKMGVIERLDFKYVKGVSGSVSYFPANTPGMFYLIRILQDQGIKLRTIKKYMDLLELNKSSFESLKVMIEKNKEAIKAIDLRLDIGPNPKQKLSKESFKRILNFRLVQISLIRDELEEFKRFLELRGYAELDYHELTEYIVKEETTIEEIRKLEEVLDKPEIKINLKNTTVPISIHYAEPVNKLICFSNKGMKVY